MGQLTNLYVSSSYQGLLKLTDSSTGLTPTLQTVQDGLGGNSPLQISQTEVNISGTFTVNGAPVSVNTGSLVTTSSFNAYTSSVNSHLAGLDVETGSLQLQINSKLDSSSFNSYTSSNDSKVNSLISQTGSYVTETESGSFLITGSVAGDTLTFTKGNGSQFSLQVNTGSLPAGVVSGSAQVAAFGYATTSSVTSLSSSIATTDLNQNNVIAGLATTSSLTSLSSSIASTDLAQNNRLTSLEGVTGSINRNGLITTGSVGGNQSITGSVDISGTLTATSASITYLETVYETASVIYSSGSNQFGDASDDVQTLFGTVNLPNGPLNITGSLRTSGQIRTDNNLVVIGNIQTNNIINPGSAGDITINPSGLFKVILDGDTEVTGTLKVTGGITGSLEGTASYATNANSASFAPTIIPNWVATTGSNTFVGNQIIQGALEINSPNPIGTFVNIISTGTTSFLLDSPLTQFQSNGEMLFQNTLSSTGSSDINFRTQNGGDITFNTSNSGSFAVTGSVNISGSQHRIIGNTNITGSLILSGSVGPELDVKGDVLITGSVIMSGSAGVELDVKGDQLITGSLGIRSGSLYSISNNTTLNIDLYLTNSLGGQSNIIRGWNDNPGGGPAAVQANYTGSLRITGSNNIVTMPQIRATIFGGGVDQQGYISGSGNIILGNLSGMYLNTGSLLFPKLQSNILGYGGAILMNFTTSSLAGGHPVIGNNLLLGGTIVLNSNSGSLNIGNNIVGQASITSTQNFTSNNRTSIVANNFYNSVTLNAISSSISYQNNYNNAPITINNHLSSSGLVAGNLMSFTNNAVFGGTSNTGLSVWVSGSQSSQVNRNIIDNIIGGKNITISSSFVSSSNSSLVSSIIYGQNLIVSGNHASTVGGSTFIGRYNDATSLHLAQDVVFAVGTGTGTSTRRTGLYVTSGSLVGVSGSLDVKGPSVITGSLDISGSVSIANAGDLTMYGHKMFNVGAFYDTTIQSGSANVSQSLSFNTTDITQGVTVASNSRLTVANAGTYNIQFSAQLLADTGADEVWIWLKKNGTNVSDSAGKVALANNEELIATWNYVVNASAGDYFEIAWQNLNGDAVILAETASGNIPGIPSIITTVTQVR
jgi:hypothetical protein